MYQDLYERTKKVIMKDTCVNFYDEARLLCLETDALGIGLGAGLLQVRNGMNCRCDKVPGNATLHPLLLPAKAY